MLLHLENDLYIGRCGIITEQQIDDLAPIERLWRASQPKLRMAQLVEIFGSHAVTFYKKQARARIKEIKQELKDLLAWDRECVNTDSIFRGHEEDRNRLNTELKRNVFLLSMLSGKAPRPGSIGQDDITRAKQVPIESLYQGQLRESAGRLTGLCPLHQERTPSFTIYRDQNTWWCYGESAGGTVIDFVMRTKELTFIKAVKLLLNR